MLPGSGRSKSAPSLTTKAIYGVDSSVQGPTAFTVLTPFCVGTAHAVLSPAEPWAGGGFQGFNGDEVDSPRGVCAHGDRDDKLLVDDLVPSRCARVPASDALGRGASDCRATGADQASPSVAAARIGFRRKPFLGGSESEGRISWLLPADQRTWISRAVRPLHIPPAVPSKLCCRVSAALQGLS